MSLVDFTGVAAPTFGPFPAGEYVLQVEHAEVRPTSAGTGSYIYVRNKVLAGEHAGRQVIAMYNISNPNPDAQNIGVGQLHTMMYAAGKETSHLETVGELFGLTFVAKVGIQESPGYEDKNVIKSYKKHDPAVAAKFQTSSDSAGMAPDGVSFGNTDIPF